MGIILYENIDLYSPSSSPPKNIERYVNDSHARFQ